MSKQHHTIVFVRLKKIIVIKHVHDINSTRNVDSEKSEPQMGFELTTIRDLVGWSNHWATGGSVVSKGQVVGMTGTASRGYTAMYLAHMNSLTASRCHIKASHMKLTNIYEISESTFLLEFISCCCCFYDIKTCCRCKQTYPAEYYLFLNT